MAPLIKPEWEDYIEFADFKVGIHRVKLVTSADHFFVEDLLSVTTNCFGQAKLATSEPTLTLSTAAFYRIEVAGTPGDIGTVITIHRPGVNSNSGSRLA